MGNRITIGILSGAATAGILLLWKRPDDRHISLRQRIRKGLAGVMLVTASEAARWKTPRRLSKKLGLALIRRSMT